jgi:PD-(D/E)XK endonuclease
MVAALLIFWGLAMRKVPGIIRNPKKRGEWVELKFMVKAAEYGLGVTKPWGDSSRYDFGVEGGGGLVRVQVKSTMCRDKGSYACAVRPNQQMGQPYKTGDFDFLAAYVIPEDVWYIIPAKLVVKGRMGMIILTRTCAPPYMEAWHLLGGASAVIPEIFAMACADETQGPSTAQGHLLRG